MDIDTEKLNQDLVFGLIDASKTKLAQVTKSCGLKTKGLNHFKLVAFLKSAFITSYSTY